MNMLCNKVKDLGNPDSVFNNSDQSSQIQPPVPLASEPVRGPLTDLPTAESNAGIKELRRLGKVMTSQALGWKLLVT